MTGVDLMGAERQRDPRIDPLPGDVVRVRCTATVFRLDEDGDIWTESERGEIDIWNIEDWRKWAASAEVITVAAEIDRLQRVREKQNA